MAAAARADVGRDALIPPGFAAARGLREGHGPPLQTLANAVAARKSMVLMLSQTHVGDDACIVPGRLRRRRVCGRDKSRPYE